MVDIPRPAALLLDIEGTMSSQSYVLNTLYPYTRQHLPGYVAAHAGDPEVVKALADTRALAGPGLDPVEALLQWIAEDRKAPPLKLLQGLVWESGYRDGAFQGQIYEDALAALRRWRADGLPLYIYSSGSVKCQVDFYRYSERGDLRDLFAGHFDTDVGAKIEAQSYRRILALIGRQPNEVLFLSDNPRELVAAREAGVGVIQVIREDTRPDPRFPVVYGFDEIAFDDAVAA
jgi:enolase-phosphatase E1